MSLKYSTRREFLKYFKFSILFLLNSCANTSKKMKIAIQNSLYPNNFKDTLPKDWQQKNFNFGVINSEKIKNEISSCDFTLINDGWINNINFSEFETINKSYPLENLDGRSRNFLNSFEENQRNKLIPVGVVPYAIIIKNNKDLINSASQSWDFILSKKLTKKIILPKSPRTIISIAEKINLPNSLVKLKSQAMVFDDQNALNWLINSDAILAIIPYSVCPKYLKIDPRLSVVFPNQGVPLMWHFVLSKTKINSTLLVEWVKSLESKSIVDKLSSQGWFLPFKNDYVQGKYKSQKAQILLPSKQCWENSWSFKWLTNEQKITYENIWEKSSIP